MTEPAPLDFWYGLPIYRLADVSPEESQVLRGFFSIHIDGLKQPVAMLDLQDDNVIRLAASPFGFEPTSLRLWARLAAQADVVLDIGAYTGIYGLVAAAMSSTSLVVAFEPSPVTFPRLLVNIQANALQARVAPINVALSDENGTAELKMFGGIYTMSSGETIADNTQLEAPFRRVVQTRKGDDLMASLDEELAQSGLTMDVAGRTVSLMKIDVEGHETEVVSGLLRLVNEHQPLILLEAWDQDALDHVLDLLPGYAFVWISESGVLQNRKPSNGQNVLLWPDVIEAHEHIRGVAEALSLAWLAGGSGRA